MYANTGMPCLIKHHAINVYGEWR